MEPKDLEKLGRFGFDPFFEQQLSALGGGVPARVVAEHRGLYEVQSADKDGSARLAGRLVNELEVEAYPGVGDWVVLRSVDEGTAVIESILERKIVFMRGAAGRRTRGQVVAANVDVVFAVTGLDGDFSVRRIER